MRYALLSFYFFIFGNWLLSFTSLDEGRNMSAVLGMIRSGDFIIPYYNCQPRFEKPPMLYWFVSISSLAIGLGEFSARLVSGLSATGVALFTYIIAKRELKEDTAKKSFLVLLTIPHLWIESRAVVPEMLNTLFMIGSLYFLVVERFLFGWLFLALTFLTKGPVGVVLTLGVYLMWKRNLKFLSFKGILLFLLMGCSWYFFMLYKFGYQYFFKFFIYENLMRYTGERLTHPAPFHYYLMVILLATAFYLPRYPNLLRKMRGELLPYALWFLFVVLFFTFAENKLHHYILFAYPPLAIMIAHTTGENYIRRTLYLASLLLLFLFLPLHLYEKQRFTPKAYPIVKGYKGEVAFYRAEDSALVFYSQKCITKLEEPSKAKGMVITKTKYVGEFGGCSQVLEGREFDGQYVLLDCSGNIFKEHEKTLR